MNEFIALYRKRRININVVNLCFYAEGYYSGQEYEENVTISEEMYKKIKNEIDNMEVYISDLDGKHSEVLGKIDVQPCKESEIADWYSDTKNDGDSFWERLQEICQVKGLDIVKDVKEVEKFIQSLDFNVEVTLSIRKSKVDELKAFAESLK